MPLTSLVGPHSGTGTYLDANASASEPQLIQIAKPSADTHMGVLTAHNPSSFRLFTYIYTPKLHNFGIN